MDLKEKINELVDEIKVLQTEVDSKIVRIKLLTKSLKAYEKLLAKAEEIDSN